MWVKELVDIIDGVFAIVSKDGSKYESGSSIPEKVLNTGVISLQVDVDRMLINIEEPAKSESLEDLGYSFEVGV